nr:transposase [uncultured Acetatifactor sp.]
MRYISRCLGRPVIALSRIDSYDGENITFHYNRHKDNVLSKRPSRPLIS